MPVKVKIPTMMREQSGGQPVVEGGGQTVREVLSDIEARYPGLTRRIVTEDGSLHRFVNLYVNDEDVRYLGSLETAVGEGDTISVLPAVAGGSSPSSS
jgi:molybdopterin synthase sulfur carrier subunit